MITPPYVRTMAAYNAEMNRRLYEAATACPRPSGGATGAGFWGSIHGTLAHILWGDGQWMSRFDGWPRPATPIKESDHLIEDWAELCAARDKADADISRWAAKVDEAWLDEDLTWFSGAAGREISAPKRLFVTHFFNHQTHHRGQAHALITAAGEKTDDTDLFLVVPQMIALRGRYRRASPAGRNSIRAAVRQSISASSRWTCAAPCCAAHPWWPAAARPPARTSAPPSGRRRGADAIRPRANRGGSAAATSWSRRSMICRASARKVSMTSRRKPGPPPSARSPRGPRIDRGGYIRREFRVRRDRRDPLLDPSRRAAWLVPHRGGVVAGRGGAAGAAACSGASGSACSALASSVRPAAAARNRRARLRRLRRGCRSARPRRPAARTARRRRAGPRGAPGSAPTAGGRGHRRSPPRRRSPR